MINDSPRSIFDTFVNDLVQSIRKYDYLAMLFNFVGLLVFLTSISFNGLPHFTAKWSKAKQYEHSESLLSAYQRTAKIPRRRYVQ